MLQFFINLRNLFYTRSSRKKSAERFGYKLSMSALFMPYYFVLLSIIDVLLKKFANIKMLESSGNERFLGNVLGNVIFWLPLVFVMFILFRILRQYDPVLMEKEDEKKWLIIVIAIFVSGIFTFAFLLRHIYEGLGLI